MQKLLQSAVDNEVVPFAIAARITREGIVEEAASGGAAMNSIFRIASMTKAITSVAIMQLVEQGKLALDAPAATYIELMRDKRVLAGFDADGTPRLRDPASQPTIRQLLTHTAGFAYVIWNADLLRVAQQMGMDMSGDVGADILNLPLTADPGARWEYGINTDVLGVIVESVSGRSLADYFAEHVFDPLGMTDSHFNVPEEKQQRALPAFSRRPEGLVQAMQGIADVTFYSGGGGLASTPNDYGRFLQALLRGGELAGERILERATVDLMARNHTGTLPINPMITASPRFSADCDFFPGQPKHWGLGFLINEQDIPGRRRAGSLAWAGVYNTHYWIDLQSGFAGLLMTQLLPFCDPAFLKLYEDVERAFYSGE
jgi:CubicO group peptidase (beta-lactamase class C family)